MYSYQPRQYVSSPGHRVQRGRFMEEKLGEGGDFGQGPPKHLSWFFKH